MIYLDHAATTSISLSAQVAMQALFNQNLRNASASHSDGRKAMTVVESSLITLAEKLSCQPSELVFTSGGTESNNWVLQQVAFAAIKEIERPRIITSSIEHSSISQTAKMLADKGLIDWQTATVDPFGRVKEEELSRLINESTVLVSVCHGNNEIGTVQNIESIGLLCQKHRVLFHSDACQTFCRLPIQLDRLSIDFLTINSHKIGGPKGIGALFIRRGVEINPMIVGGGQQRGLRSGTLPVELIGGFAVAAKEALGDPELLKLAKIREYTQKRLLQEHPEAIENGINSVAHIFSFSIRGRTTRNVVRRLSDLGVAVSAGAACGSQSDSASTVLLALGRERKDAHHIRVSFSPLTQEHEVDRFFAQLRIALNE